MARAFPSDRLSFTDRLGDGPAHAAVQASALPDAGVIIPEIRPLSAMYLQIEPAAMPAPSPPPRPTLLRRPSKAYGAEPHPICVTAAVCAISPFP